MQPQRPPFWEWPLDRLNVLLLTGALIVLLLLSVFNFTIQRRASDLALATPTPLGPPVVQTVITIAPPARRLPAPPSRFLTTIAASGRRWPALTARGRLI